MKTPSNEIKALNRMSYYLRVGMTRVKYNQEPKAQKRYDESFGRGIDEQRLQVVEVHCAQFGCGRRLTKEEKLFGNKCINHQHIKPFKFHHNY